MPDGRISGQGSISAELEVSAARQGPAGKGRQAQGVGGAASAAQPATKIMSGTQVNHGRGRRKARLPTALRTRRDVLWGGLSTGRLLMCCLYMPSVPQ